MVNETLLPLPGNDSRSPSQPVSSPTAGPVYGRPRRSRRQRALALALGIPLLWLIVAYLVMPAYWRHYVARHPALGNLPDITHTRAGIPGDPINVALIGTEEELKNIMDAAGWFLARPLSLRSDLKIAIASVLNRADNDAPVSSLYLWGRREDFAFERNVGNSPRQRHHVRFWKADETDLHGRPVWAGSAIFDQRVGLSRTTGQFTHHTAPDIDTERNKLFSDLINTGDLVDHFLVDDFRIKLEGRNGGGDPWFTDGRLAVGVIDADRR